MGISRVCNRLVKLVTIPRKLDLTICGAYKLIIVLYVVVFTSLTKAMIGQSVVERRSVERFQIPRFNSHGCHVKTWAIL